MSHTTTTNNAMIRPLTYIQVLGMYFPELEIMSLGDGSVYEDLVVTNGGELPTQAELDAEILEDFQTHRIADLSARCQQDIITGFESDGLGYPCIYDSEEIDQLNLIGAVATTAPDAISPEGYTQYYAVRPVVDNVIQPKTYVLHNNVHLRKVLADGAVVKLAKLQKFNIKRYYVGLATSLNAVNAITWESVE